MIRRAFGALGLLMVTSCAATTQTPTQTPPAAPADASAQDRATAVMYVQSIMAPAMLEVCKVALPDGAARMDVALARWRERNQATVAEGERDLRAASARDGVDLDRKLASRRESLLRQLHAMEPAGRVERCATLIDILEHEAR